MLVLALFGASTVTFALRLFHPFWADSGWPDAVLLALAGVATLAAFAGQIPVPNVLLAGGIAAGIGGLAHAVNDVTGLPFGRFEFTSAMGPRLLNVLPVAMPLLWAVLALNARGAARRLLFAFRLHPRHGYHVMALAVILMTIFHLVLTSFGVCVKFWWTINPEPFLNFASLTLLSLIIQIAVTPLLLDKFPVPRLPSQWPLWILASLLFLVLLGVLGSTCGLSP